MDDELLAGEPPLVGVMGAGVGKRCLDAIPGDRKGLVSVFLDDGEEVAQQPALERRELRILDRGFVVAGNKPVDARALRGQRGEGAILGRTLLWLAVGARITATVSAADRPAQAAARRFALFRYR